MEVEKVQNIAIKYKNNDEKSSPRTIPSEFIRPENEQPAKTTVHGTELEVPTIDLGDPDEERLVELISKASQDWGLFQVVNHGIPIPVIDKLQAAGKHFFELPQEEKDLYAQPPGYHGDEGYGNKLTSITSTTTTTTDANAVNANAVNAAPAAPSARPWVDHLFHRIWPPSAIDYQFWPKNPPSYREANEEYAQYLRGVIQKLFKCWAKGLDISEQRLIQAASGDDMVYLAKINYYPPCPWPDMALGVPPHTDLSLLTILVPNHVPGLQVSRDGLWYNVHYIPNALVIHIGDQLEVLSNGKYKAVLHRTTVNKDHTRMSWPVFIEPPPQHLLGPLPELITQQNPPKYKTKKYVDYKYCKLNKLPQ